MHEGSKYFRVNVSNGLIQEDLKTQQACGKNTGKAIPYFMLACEQAIKAHHEIGDVFFMAWDVIISNEGPIFLEGNAQCGLTIADTLDELLWWNEYHKAACEYLDYLYAE